MLVFGDSIAFVNGYWYVFDGKYWVRELNKGIPSTIMKRFSVDFIERFTHTWHRNKGMYNAPCCEKIKTFGCKVANMNVLERILKGLAALRTQFE